MATQTAHITWDPVAGSLGYLIEYKEMSSSTWLTPGPPANPANPTLNTFYDLEVTQGLVYNGRVTSRCATGRGNIRLFTIIPNDPTPVLVWEEDTYQCTQAGDAFSLQNTYTGFSSPQNIFWDNTSQRYYVVDADDAAGNFWWFNPATMSGFGSANHIAGLTADINFSVFDPTNRRIIAAGDTTGGAKVLNIATNTITTLAYGVDGSPGTGIRTPIALSSSSIYCFCSNPNNIYVYNRNTLALTNTINKTLIPSNGIYLVSGYTIIFVGSEIWSIPTARSDGDIARYDSTFTNLLGTISLPGATKPVAPWTALTSFYWMTNYYDAPNNRLYVADIGSNKLYTINTLTRGLVLTVNIIDRRGKAYAISSFFKNTLDNKVYVSLHCVDDLTDNANNYKLYTIDINGRFQYIYPDQSVSTLSLRSGTNQLWGVNPGRVIWDSPNTGYATDGTVTKYTQS